MDWKKVGAIIAALAGIVGLARAAVPFIASDPPPYASVSRVDSVTAEIIAGHIDDAMKDYCESERTHNRAAAVAVMRTLGALETDYSNHTGGRSWPFNPCP